MGAQEKGMLRVICSHGFGIKSDLKECNHATDGNCLCGETDTPTHRMYSGPTTQAFRDGYDYPSKT